MSLNCPILLMCKNRIKVFKCPNCGDWELINVVYIPACRRFHKLDASGEPEWLTPAWLSEDDIDIACEENWVSHNKCDNNESVRVGWLATGASLDYIYCNGCGCDWQSFEELENAGGLVEIDESEFDKFLQEC